MAMDVPLAVRAPSTSVEGGDLVLDFAVSAPDQQGARTVSRAWAAKYCNRSDVPDVRVLRGESLDVRVRAAPVNDATVH